MKRPEVELFDSHAHLTFKDFETDLPEVLERARAAGVTGIITIGSGGGKDVHRAARRLAAEHSQIWATAGLHPHDARHFSESFLAELTAAAGEDGVVGIGETGLDFHYNYSPPEDQRRAFTAQIRLARELGKPLIIHTREAEDATLQILEAELPSPAGGVIHCFSGGPEFAEKMVALGFHISFSGIVTFPKARDVQAAAAVVPDDRLLLETDSPFLAPPPKRGRRNEPARVEAVAAALADLRGVTVADIGRITTRNVRRLFALELPDGAAPIVYAIRDQLYVNVTNRCSLTCVFCPKRRDWTVKGHYLKHAADPDDDAVRGALEKAHPESYREVVFCGLGEPTIRLELILELGEKLRKVGIRTRLDTDGLASLREGRDVVPDLARAFDAVSVSLNAADPATYVKLCPSEYGVRAFEAAVAFLRAARRFGQRDEGGLSEVTASVVSVPELDLESARRLVEEELDVRFRVRKYNVVG